MDLIGEFDPDAEFVPIPRRTKTKRTEALHLLADIEFEGEPKFLLGNVLDSGIRSFSDEIKLLQINIYKKQTRSNVSCLVWLRLRLERASP
jgi:hypothetical protein